MENREDQAREGMLPLAEPVTLPPVLDVLIVGGGPAGTAAAFRAKELGLAALVIDYDDIMKRIRDYAKDKLILPDFGGGDKMAFPVAGPLIEKLSFSPMDKDDMFTLWKSWYGEYSIPAQTGVELLGLAGRSDGAWNVRVYNHNTKNEGRCAARHVVLAIGRGVPRRFDIPGNADGIAYRLNDAAAYIGEPACVIGGGTSAAEAVIEISHAKTRAGDTTAVYWSYRGDKLPKVSKALAEVFFEAYIGNGNIRYHPGSEPVAVVTGPDKREYLTVRTDRRMMNGRPNESVHFEFLKEYCIACIGEDIPEGLLASMGISLVTGGPSKKKRMAVTTLLETQQPCVYLIGDILSQAYLEVTDFAADPAEFPEIKHRGNIKAAIVDGVYVMDVIRQRLDGVADVQVQVQFADAPPAGTAPRVTMVPASPDAAPPPAPREMQQDADAAAAAYLVRLLPGNVEENEYALQTQRVTRIGRSEADIVFADDPYLAETHASIVHGPDGSTLRDDSGGSGVLLRLPEGVPYAVQPGDLLKLGRQFLLFRGEGRVSEYVHYDRAGKEIRRYPVPEKTVVLGREAPDITLDADDGTLSRRHLSITLRNGLLYAKDLKSVNGTWRKIVQAAPLQNGDEFRLGQQTFRYVQKVEITSDRRHSGFFPPMPAEAPPAAAPAPAAASVPVPASAAAGASAPGEIPDMVVLFPALGVSAPFEKGNTVCDAAEKSGVKIVAECHAGICGSDPIRIIAGREHLAPPGDDETGTLEDICGLEAGECRLACMVRPTRGIAVEILSNG